MLIMAIASMFAAASVDTAASAQRAAFSNCLKQAIASAKASKISVDAFDAYARGQCAAPEADLRKAVMSIDMKNGISRKDAAENAQFELNDYFVSTAERYQAEMDVEPKEAQPQAQAQAQPPTQPQPQPQPQQ
jgi:hypothetical protein